MSELIKKLKPIGKQYPWTILRVFTLLFMLSFILGGYFVYTDNYAASNILMSIVFFCGGMFIVVVIISITKQHVALEESIKSDSEKETLLKEIHHRVKNNLQIIISLLRLGKAKLSDPKGVDAITNCENKVHTMATLHESLYRTKDLSNVNFKAYVAEILDHVSHSLAGSKTINKNLNICEANFNLDLLIPLGLIMNEILANTVKHAFNGTNEGTISIHLLEENRGSYTLTVHDSGPGIPKDFFKLQSNGLGSELIHGLVSQIDGEVSIINFSSSTAFEIKFGID
ncbi:MAG: ATP-binding protein [Flavobacteriales bacterium]|nr:ATP-binding protein [Flavobacteriales bacterium]